MNEQSCLRCRLPLKVHITCGCGAQRILIPQCKSCAEYQKQLLKLVMGLRVFGTTSMIELQETLKWDPDLLAETVEEAIKLGVVSRDAQGRLSLPGTV